MKISDAKTLLTTILKYNIDQHLAGVSHKHFIIPCFIGDPGVGKTSIPNQVAAEEGVPLHTTIIAQYDAGEMGGFGIPTDVVFEEEDDEGKIRRYTEKRVIRARPDYLPDPRTPEGVVGIWNLDELMQAFLANQNICSQIVNEYRVGEHPISHGITICCTGNKPENKAGTTTMPMHLRDRLMFINIEADHKDFNDYANQRGLHRWVRAFVQKNPAFLHKFEVGVNAFPSPRSWERTSELLKMGHAPHILTECLYGQIGEGMASQFLAWVKVEDRLPSAEDVVKDPEGVPVFGDRDADVNYMLMANLVEVADKKNLGQIIKYLKRMPNKEFVAMWAKDVQQRHPEVNDLKEMTEFKLSTLTKILI
jgi:hypothetical protein